MAHFKMKADRVIMSHISLSKSSRKSVGSSLHEWFLVGMVFRGELGLFF